MSKPSPKVQEPSMEEILASIRRIISDDDTVVEAAREVRSPTRARDPEAELAASAATMNQEAVDALLSRTESARENTEVSGVLELTDTVETASPGTPRAPEAADIVFREQEAGPASALTPRTRRDDALLSEHTTAAVSAAFDSLTHTFFSQNARSIEDLVREMLRPMLKHWLDDNLPSLVERLVRNEIDRVSRGR